jgi:hypothetical protein
VPASKGYRVSTQPHLMTLIAMERASEMLNTSFSGTRATFLLALVKSIDLILNYRDISKDQ